MLKDLLTKGRRWALAMALAAVLPSHAADTHVTFWGQVIHADSWSETSRPYGLHYFENGYDTINLYSLENTSLGTCDMSAGGAWTDSRLYFIYYYTTNWGFETIYLYTYDITTEPWTQLSVVPLYDTELFSPAGTAYDPASGRIYGIFYTADGAGYEFGAVDYTLVSRNKIATVDRKYVAFAISPMGTPYAIDSVGDLYMFDKTTGEQTLVGSTGVTPSTYVQSMTFDAKTGTLWWAASLGTTDDFHTALYWVDTTTGAATWDGDFSYNTQIAMLRVAIPEAEDQAPAAAEDFAVNYETGSFEGTATFTIPSTTYSGEALTGTVNWTISVGDETIAAGVASPSENVTTPVTMTASGSYTFTLVLSNAYGSSPKVEAEAYAGYPKPNTVNSVDVTLSRLSGKVTVTWTPSYTLKNSSIIPSADDFTFNVTRYPDRVRYTGLTETQLVEKLSTTSLKTFYYEVTQQYGDAESDAVQSRVFTIGSKIELPWHDDFSFDGCLNSWTIIDGNSNGYTWEYESGNVSCYTGGGADDWLISGEIDFEEGRQYTFTLTAFNATNYYPETLEVMTGEGTDPTSWTQTLIPVTVLSVEEDDDQPQTLQATFTAPATATQRIGIHTTSSGSTITVYLSSVNMVAGATSDSPAASTNLVATPGEKGALTAMVEFDTPTLTYGGAELSSLTKVEVYRDDQLVETINSVTPGQHCVVEDTSLTQGSHSYIIYACNDHGNGDAATVNVYTGIDIPKWPADYAFQRALVDNFDGTVTLLWPLASEGVNGGYIDQSSLTHTIYNIGRYTYEPWLTDLHSNEYTLTLDDYSQPNQQFIYWGISQTSSGGTSSIVSSAPYLMGVPYDLPIRESFPGAELGDLYWWTYSDGNKGGFTSDGYDDDGTFVFTTTVEGGNSMLLSGKIDLSTAKRPYIVYNYKGSDKNKVNVVVNPDFRQYTDVPNTEVTPSSQWQTAAVDLTQYAQSHYSLVGVRNTSSDDITTKTYIDNIRIYDMHDCNLAAMSMSTPESIHTGQSVNVTVKIENQGLNDVTGAKVLFYVGDRLATTVDNIDLKAFIATDVTGTVVIAGIDPESTTLSAKIEYTYDEVEDDNILSTPIQIVKSSLAGAWLNGELTEDYDVQLSWTAPTSSASKQVESFESYEPWVIDSFAPWTTYDGDQATTYFVYDDEGYTIVPGGNSPMAFQLWAPSYLEDVDNAGLDSSVLPYDGDKCLVSFNPEYDTTNSVAIPADDWLISPELSGVKQTISFFAKSFTTNWGNETFEILYSTTDIAVGSFQVLVEEQEATGEWAEYPATLPEGAKYFAVHVTSVNNFAFMIDQVTYYQGVTYPTGYRLWRDGVLLAELPAGTTSYKDSPSEIGVYTYQLTVVYPEGESAAVNSVVLDTDPAGVGSITADSLDSPYTIYSLDGRCLGYKLDKLPKLSAGFYIINNRKVAIQ